MRTPAKSIIVALTCTLGLPTLAFAAQSAAAKAAANTKSLERSYRALYSGAVHVGQTYDHMGGDKGRVIVEPSAGKFVLKDGKIHINFVDPTATQNGVVSINLGKNPRALKPGDRVIDPQAAIAYRTVLESARSGGFDALPMSRKPANLGKMTKLALPDTVRAGAGAYGTDVVIHNELFVDYKTNTVYGASTGDHTTYVKLGTPLEFATE